MSSKENKKMAQERRAKEREKAEQQAKNRKILIGLAVVAAIALVIIIPGVFGGSPDSEEEATDAAVEETTEGAADGEEATAEEVADEEAAADEATADEPALDTTEGRVVADGDTVNIDYTGYKDGEPFDGGSTNGAGADLTIGSHSYIDGFESGLIGKKVGETVDLNLTFPKDYGAEDLAGQDVVFTVTINGIYDK